ncbi:hypothetical protein EEB19_22480 [Gordonia sp. OPL2]|nr:hypothetical protein EEB19_22480 [Gordonia sp. OPL2]
MVDTACSPAAGKARVIASIGRWDDIGGCVMERMPEQVSVSLVEPQLPHVCMRGGGQMMNVGIGCQRDQSIGSLSPARRQVVGAEVEA